MHQSTLYMILLGLLIATCQPVSEPEQTQTLPSEAMPSGPALVVLGTLQDGGLPHIGCVRACCKDRFADPDPDQMVVSLGLLDPEQGKAFLLEATPDLPAQIDLLNRQARLPAGRMPDGILVTHAHIGHYAGLLYLGREARNSDRVPVYAMPRLKAFLETNGPWSQLVELENIALREIQADTWQSLSPNLRIMPIRVPHRDEFSETVGFLIAGPAKKALFIPDIDKWEKWTVPVEEVLGTVDYALLDGTFYDAAELDNRDMSEIPHPSIAESMARFSALPDSSRSKIRFIHFNHTNPVLEPDGEAARLVRDKGFGLAEIYETLPL